MSARATSAVLLLAALAAVGGALPTRSQEAPASARMQVGGDGLLLYPRWNKLFAPLASLAPGETLDVLADRGGWKQVAVLSSSARGWVFCETAPPAGGGQGLSLPLAASPTTSGLVVKGWSAASYAGRRGADPALVEALLRRSVDHVAFQAFLAQDPPPAPGAAPDKPATPAAGAGTKPAADLPPWERDKQGALDELDGLVGSDEVARDLRSKNDALGRQRLDVPLSESLTELDELALGTAVAARVLAETPALPEGALSTYVSLVGLRLVDGLPHACNRWTFAVLDSDAVNAFSLPGGFVFVTRGAVEACEDEAELAALLAHEVAHVALRHAVRSLDQSLLDVLRDATRRELDALAPAAEATAALIDELSAVGDELFAMTQQPFHHDLETEADQHAVRLLQRAGYDARASVALLLELARREGGLPALASHPAARDRLAVVKTELAGTAPSGSLNAERFRAALAAFAAELEAALEAAPPAENAEADEPDDEPTPPADDPSDG